MEREKEGKKRKKEKRRKVGRFKGEEELKKWKGEKKKVGGAGRMFKAICGWWRASSASSHNPLLWTD